MHYYSKNGELIDMPEQEALRLLKQQFRSRIPTGQQVFLEAINAQLGQNRNNPDWIKSHFSELVESTQIGAYGIYKRSEQAAISPSLREVFGRLLPAEPTREDFLRVLEEHAGTLDEFFLSLTQGRRSRAGKAFEHIIKTLFDILGYPYTPQAIINGQPDFLLPSQEHFTTNAMDCIIFTVKRTLRERWRQIVTEGLRGHQFFLATIDEKKGQRDLQEMQSARIYLVVPARIKNGNERYTGAPNVISFETFFAQHLDPAMVRWRNNGVIH